jgi:hypothetical protein
MDRRRVVGFRKLNLTFSPTRGTHAIKAANTK